MNIRSRFVDYCALILVFQFINIPFSFDSFSTYSSRRVKDSSSALWQKLEIIPDYKTGESLILYGLKLVGVEYKPLLADGSLDVTEGVVTALELSTIQALVAFNHRGDGRVSSNITETNVATISRKIINEIAKRYGLRINIAGNEGQVEEGLSAIKVKEIFNADGEKDVMLELDGVEGSAFLLSGRENQPPVGEKGYEQGAWSAVSLMDSGNNYCADMYKLTVAYNGTMENIDPAASPEEIMQKIALGMGYSGYDDPNFKKEISVLMMDRPRHEELRAELQDMGFDIIPLIHGDCLPLIIAGTGLKVDGKKFVVINAGGSHEEYIARAVARNTPGGVQISRYATHQLSNSDNLSGWDQFTRQEIEELKYLGIYNPEVFKTTQKDIDGNPVVVLTSITGMRENIFKDLSSNFPGIEINPDTGNITLFSLVSTKEGLFVVRTKYHTDSLEITNRKLLTENVHYPNVNELSKILSDVEDNWEMSTYGSVQNRLGKLYTDLQSSGLASLASFSDYSSNWLKFYLNTVLKEDELNGLVLEIRKSVLLMKKIVEADDFSTLMQDADLKEYPAIMNLIESLKYDLLRDNFLALTDEGKENILETVAGNIPYSQRMGFYMAFQPKLYKAYKQNYDNALKEAVRICQQIIRSCEGSSYVLFRGNPISIDLDELIPGHQVSTDIGLGSDSYKNRSAEINKGVFIPIVVLRIGPEYYIQEGNARILAAFKKDITEFPAFVITVKNPSPDFIKNWKDNAKTSGILSVEDLELKPLSLPQVINTDDFSAGIIKAESSFESFKLMGIGFMKELIDSVKERGKANVLIDINDVKFLKSALDSNKLFKTYLKYSSAVNLFFKIPEGISPEKVEEINRSINNIAVDIGVSPNNIYRVSNVQELADSLGEGDEIDVAICDISSIEGGSGILSSVYNPGMKVISIVADKQQGMLLQEMINRSNSEVLKKILDNPQNILISEVDNIRSLLPEDMRPAPETVTLKDLSVTPEGLGAIISDIESAVTSAKEFGHPALVAVDGWEGAGRGTVIDKIKAELQALHPEYKIGILNIEDYYLSEGERRKEVPVVIPEIAGNSVASNNGIGIRREDANNITVLTSFDETTLPLPGIGQEVKVKGHAIYIKRVDPKTLSIRLSPVIADVELGRFYRDIQNLQQGESVHTQISEGDMVEINPQDCDLIFVRGELTLHQESINSLYNLRLFVDADFSARLERIIRQHIFDGLYPDIKTPNLTEYLNQQRAVLEDQFLFSERDRADYTVLNNVYPDDGLLNDIYKLDLSQRIDKSIEIAKEEGQNFPWVVLKNYVLSVVGLGSNFREVIQNLVDANEKKIVPFNRNTISLLDMGRQEISIDLLNHSEKEFLYSVLREIGLLKE